ncbi:7868_t:CDS:2 [Cetraspora pellucida]|uniref:7868_t:CDS:1 n=1 Tax=Cetraspora pellucida TaxID=1433469 RepID=A0A9N9NMI3_9GLOM|nr:7868_t:CDS:2 [Cetraspora pellucida]
MTVLNSVGIAHSRERVFIFGGIDKLNTNTSIKVEGVPMYLSYIYNVTGSQILIPGYQLLFAFAHSVVGVVGDYMFIIVLSFNDYLENRQMTRLHAAGVQPPGSDVVLIYGGVTYQNSSSPNIGNTSNMMLVYNMTLCSWTDIINLVTDASANNFAFIDENYSTTLNSSNSQQLQMAISTPIVATTEY